MYLFEPYDNALDKILSKGVLKSNKRTGVKTLAICGIESRYKLDTGYFPVMTRRKTYPKSIFAELLWFISGSTNNKDLQALGANIWTPWVSKEFEDKHGYAEGSFGPVYGFQLRHFGGYYGDGVGGPSKLEKSTLPDNYKTSMYGFCGVDQLAYMMKRIKDDPSCRRILFSLWNPRDLDKMRLPPCHIEYQVMIDDCGRLSGHLTQRSCDFPIGIPANIQFYSALTCMIAQQTGYEPFEFVHETVDSHIYWDQIDAVKEYLNLPIINSPSLKLNKATSIYEYKLGDFVLEGFKPGPKLEIPVAV